VGFAVNGGSAELHGWAPVVVLRDKASS
jgi:hypothetical protein